MLYTYSCFRSRIITVIKLMANVLCNVRNYNATRLASSLTFLTYSRRLGTVKTVKTLMNSLSNDKRLYTAICRYIASAFSYSS